MSKRINLTPHECNVYRKEDDALLLSVPASGTLARCTEEVHRAYPFEFDGVEVDIGSKSFGEIEGLPALDPNKDVAYFVSALVATAAWEQGRTDVVCPLESKHDENGRTIGTYGLSVHPSLCK